jgi:CHAT domain-containing protein
MTASQLRLAGAQHLTARDVLTWNLRANLLFLNACQAGQFRLSARTEINGFVRAFLLAGAKSLVAPLVHVAPDVAGDLAATFFQEWLGGCSCAEALNRAQIVLKKQGADIKDWGSYCLYGDFL